ncbi:hypothetical protein FBU31_007912, partial [Coemansia sp. 'formosensis']
SSSGRFGLADEQTGEICFNLTHFVCRDKHHPDDSYQRLYSYDLPTPTYSGMVRACGFADVVERLGHLAREEGNQALDSPEHAEARQNGSCFLPAEPQSDSASSHDLGDVAAMLCAISRYLQRGEHDILIFNRSRVDYLVSALEWVTNWIPVFEERIRGDLWAAVIRTFVYLVYRTPSVLQEVLRESAIFESGSWDSGHFWRSSYTAVYDMLDCNSFELSSEYMSTFMNIKTRFGNLPNDSVGTVYRYMTAHLILLSSVSCVTPDSAHRESYAWRDILAERFVMGDMDACVLHAHSSCEWLINCLLNNLGSFRRGDPECASMAVVLLVMAVFHI